MKKPLLIMFLFLTILVSCVKKPADVDLEGIELSEVLTKVREREENIKSVKGLSTVRVETPQRGVISFKQVTIAEEPNLLRIEALDPLGRTVGMVTSDGEKINLIFPEETQVFDGLYEFDLSYIYPDLPARITVTNLVNFLLGGPPEKIDYDDSKVYMSKTLDHLILSFFNESGEKESVLWVSPVNYRIEKAEVSLDGGGRATSEFDDFIKTDDGFFFPKKLELRFGDSVISVRYDDEVRINSPVSRDLFSPPQPVVGFEKIF